MSLIRSHILVCTGTGCTSSESPKIIAEFEKQLAAQGMDKEAQVVRTGCFGLCALGPIVVIYPEGSFYSMVKEEDVKEIVDEHLLKGRPVTRLLYDETVAEDNTVKSLDDTAFYKKQMRIALRNCGRMEFASMEAYIARDGYAAAAKALDGLSREEVVEIMKASGLRGRGGAGFPTHVKLAAEGIDTLLINAAECEPYLSTDTREMLECSDTILSGITAVMKYCNIPNCIIGIERNKPECIDLMCSLVRDMQGVSVKPLPMRYPQGAEKTLVETCTGREVPQIGPSGKPGLPADVHCIIMNVTSVSTLGKFLKTGVPLTTKRVTVEGDAIAKPQNIEVPIGTLYRDVIEACGGIKEGVELGKIIFGGPMMGGAAPSADYPVLKQNNGLLLFSKQAAVLPEPSACIRCGRCIEVCPMGLEPVEAVAAFNNKDFDTLKARCVDLCVACGSCTYACPAKRPVSQTMTLAKAWYLGELRKGGK